MNIASMHFKKSLGQNFLVNDDISNEIASIIEIKGKNIIEIGPGYGALTKKILEKSPRSLTLVEIDKFLISALEEKIKSNDLEVSGTNFELIESDILQFKPRINNYSVIANIPYYITSEILKHLVYDFGSTANEMVLMMQKDVGDKILNPKTSSVLGLILQKKYIIEEKIIVGREDFYPAPNVDSSVLLFVRHDEYENIPNEKFLRIIKSGFKTPRKKLINNLLEIYGKEKLLSVFEKLGIDENIRGEELGVKEWMAMINRL